MFAMIKQIFNPKNKDLQKRILFTFAALLIFKIGTTIVVPGVDNTGIENLGFLELLNVMGGGAMSNFSIFALGVGPYITASIIIQLLQMDIVPYLTELSKQGGTGRAKINQITRIVGIILAFIQGYMFSFTYLGKGSVIDYMQFSIVLTAGTCFVLWLGDQITAKGIGNGISIIIMCGIIASMPTMFGTAWSGFTGMTDNIFLGIGMFVLFLIIYLAIIIGIIYIQSAERRIPIQYANKTNSTYNKNQNYIPFKLNSAGVIPVIFASALVSIPGLLAGFIKKEGFTAFVTTWFTKSTGEFTWPGFVIYILLIFGFSYFYTFIQIKPKEMAENLQQNGGYIPGVRPGNDTIDYVGKILKRLTVVGALGLSVIAALPILFGKFTDLPSSVTIGGTGLLIVVGVALETYKQLESKLISRSYKRGRRRA